MATDRMNDAQKSDFLEIKVSLAKLAKDNEEMSRLLALEE
jgi:hypothetical protein